MRRRRGTTDVRTWDVWTPLAPHAEAVSRSADAAGLAEPTARLMNQLGLYRNARGQFRAAEPLYRRALAIERTEVRPRPPQRCHPPQQPGGVATATNRLAEAEPLYRRLWRSAEAVVRPRPPQRRHPTSTTWRSCCRHTNRLAEAEPLHRRALAIDEASLRPRPPQRRHEPQQPGVRCSGTPTGWPRPSRSSAALWRSTKRRTAPTTPTSPSTSTTWRRCWRPPTGWPRPSRCTAAPWRSTKRRTAPTTPTSPSGSTTWRGCCRPPTGWPRPSRSTAGAGDRRGVVRPRPPRRRHEPQQPGGVAAGHQPAGRGRAALPPCPGDRRGVATAPTTPTSPQTSTTWRCCSQAPTGWPRPSRSTAVPWRSARQSYGPDHPTVADSLNNLALLLRDTNRLAEAEPLYRRALAIDEAVVRPRPPRRRRRPQQPGAVAAGHEPAGRGRAALPPRPGDRRGVVRPRSPRRRHRPQQPGAVAAGHEPAGRGRAALPPRPGDRRGVATAPTTPTSPATLNNLAGLLRATNRLAEAEPLYRRALAIDEASGGADHPNVATTLNNLAVLLRPRTGWLRPSRSSAARSDPDRVRARTGYEHPRLQHVLTNYRGFLKALGKTSEQIEQELNDLNEPS